MNKPLLFTLIFFSITVARGQSCNCDVTLTGLSSTSLNLVWASQINYSPGDTICILSGNYGEIRFYDFQGTESAPLTIINCGGPVTINGTAYYAGIDFRNSKHIRFTGSGDANTTYGFHIESYTGINLSAFSTDIEIDHVEVSNTDYASLIAKTDPDCNDPNTWRSSGFIMKNLDIHDNYFHDSYSEGIYMGHPSGYELQTSKTCNGNPVFAHWLEDVDIHDNRIENIGREAIQLHLIRSNGKIRDNQIINYGYRGNWGQSWSMNLFGGTYEVFNNSVINGIEEKGWGIQLISGQSGTKIYNNEIVRPQRHGLDMHARHKFDDVNSGYNIYNNTIIEPTYAGMRYNAAITIAADPADHYRNQDEVPCYFVNNLVVDPGYDYEGGNTWKQGQESYFDFNSQSTRNAMATNIYSNITTRQMDTLGLADIAQDDYRPGIASSSLVDSGSDLISWGLTYDLENMPRPMGNAMDVGAFEFDGVGTDPVEDPLASCNCDVVLANLNSNTLNLIYASQTNYSPGDTICIPAGDYGGVRFYDFEGTEQNPLTITNCGGQATFNESTYSGIEFRNSKYIHLTGTGETGVEYGLKVTGTGAGSMGLVMGALSTDFEVDHLEIAIAGFAGIMAKTDPDCSNPDTWRANGFIMKNLNIHHNYIHDTEGEGVYIGYTGAYLLNSSKFCNGTAVYGHWLENVDVHHNLVENTGWDGIQLNLVQTNGKIRDNIIRNYGHEGIYAQAFAMSLGGGTYEVYNNYAENGPLQQGWGMQLISGQSGTKIYNNVFIKPSENGIFLHARHDFNDVTQGYFIFNNSILEPEKAGIHYNNTILHPIDPADLHREQDEVPSYFANNLIIDPGNQFENGNTWKGLQESYIDFNAISTRNAMQPNILQNMMTRQPDTLDLVDIITYDLRPASEPSPLVNTGYDVASWGLSFDMDNSPRPSGIGYDIGAYEFLSSIPLQATIPDNIELFDVLSNEQKVKTLFYPNPTSSSFRLENANYEKVHMQLISLDGKVVYNGSYTIGNSFNVEQFRSGLYFLKLITPQNTEVHRLVIR